MYNKIKKMYILKKSIISLFIAILTSVLIYGTYTLYASDEKYALKTKDLDYREIFEQYHYNSNEFFNEKIEKLVELTSSDDFFSDPEKQKLIIIPADIDRQNDSLDQIVEKCTKRDQLNVSSYCVSMESLSYYIAYVEILDSIREDIVESDAVTVVEKFDEIAEKNNSIDDEIKIAKSVLEGTLMAYEEFMHAYPMHKKYRTIIDKLLKYKLALKDIRREVQFFPGKFIDASSSQCK